MALMTLPVKCMRWSHGWKLPFLSHAPVSAAVNVAAGTVSLPPPPHETPLFFVLRYFCTAQAQTLVVTSCKCSATMLNFCVITKRWCLGEFTVSVHQMSPFVVSTTTRQADSSRGDPTGRRSWSCIIIRNVRPPACYSWEVPDEKLTFTE